MIASRRTSAITTAKALLVLSLSGMGYTAQGAEPKSAKEYFSEALVEVDRAQYSRAIELFWRAYEIQPHSSVLFNIAQAELLVGEPARAISTLERYLAEGADALSTQRRDEVERTIEAARGQVAELSIDLDAPGAEILVDGQAVGTAPLPGPLRVRAGRHLVAARLDEHGTAERWVTAAGRARQTVELRLVKPPTTTQARPLLPSGFITVDCPLDAVEVRIDGSPEAFTPPTTALPASLGPHTISFARPGYRIPPAVATVREGRPTRVRCEPKLQSPLPPAVAAQLEVALPEKAELWVDGTAASERSSLPKGPHDVVVRRAGYVDWHETTSLVAGQTTRLRVVLVATDEYREQHIERSRIQRIVGYSLGAVGLGLAAATIAHFAWNDGRHGDWETEDEILRQQGSGGAPASPDRSERQAANDELLLSVLRADTATACLGVAAGALLVSGALTVLTSEDTGEDTVEPVASPTLVGLRWKSVF